MYSRLVFVLFCVFFVESCQREPGPEQARIAELDEVETEAVKIANDCDFGEPNACFQLALYWIDGSQGFGPDLERAREILNNACDSPEKESCVLYGQLLDPWGSWEYAPYSGMTEEEAVEKMRELFSAGCSAGNETACAANTTLDAAETIREEQAAEQRRQEEEQRRQEEEQRRQEAERRRRRAERRNLLSSIRNSSSIDCRSINSTFHVPSNVCDALVEAIDEGRTSSDGRDDVRSYLRGRGVRHLRGYIIAQIDDGLYEAVRRSRDSYWDISYPSGQHFLLLTGRTTYSTRGRFDMWVYESGTHRVPLNSGFTETWKIFREENKGQLWQEVRDARAGDATRRAARNLLLYLAEH